MNTATLATSKPSLSTILPDGCTAHRCGLELRPGLSQDDWRALGRRVAEVAGAAMWMLGDLLAYGEQYYVDKSGKKRIPAGLYAQLAAETGYSEQTLRTAKCVCAALPLFRRRNKLTFSHALEIVSRAQPDRHDFWIEKVEAEGMSSKALRVQLRRANAAYAEEPNDKGVLSILEIYRQFDRDHGAYFTQNSLTPRMRKELLKILERVHRDLGVLPAARLAA